MASRGHQLAGTSGAVGCQHLGRHKRRARPVSALPASTSAGTPGMSGASSAGASTAAGGTNCGMSGAAGASISGDTSAGTSETSGGTSAGSPMPASISHTAAVSTGDPSATPAARVTGIAIPAAVRSESGPVLGVRTAASDRRTSLCGHATVCCTRRAGRLCRNVHLSHCVGFVLTGVFLPIPTTLSSHLRRGCHPDCESCQGEKATLHSSNRSHAAARQSSRFALDDSHRAIMDLELPRTRRPPPPS